MIKDFLVDRQQYVNIGNFKSSELSCDIGCPPFYFQYILILFGLPVKIFKYADDMAIVGLLST